MDVDGVLHNGTARMIPRPQMQLILDTLACLGFEVVAWSAGGGEWARDVVCRHGWHGVITRFLSKPDYPMDEGVALELVGAVPVLQIDDDALERVGSWPFMLWPTFTGTEDNGR